MILVKIYYRTEENGRVIPDDIDLEDRPICYAGPFDSMTRAISWMETDYPDGDEDIYEMIAADFILSNDVFINDPETLIGEPDEDIRDDSQEIQGT